MSKFLPSTAGTKRALTNKVLREIFDHWNEVEEKTGKTRGQMTLTHLFRSEPGNYARLIASLLPRDLIVENTLAEIDDDQIDEMIFRMRERLSKKMQQEPSSPEPSLSLKELELVLLKLQQERDRRNAERSAKGEILHLQLTANEGEDTTAMQTGLAVRRHTR